MCLNRDFAVRRLEEWRGALSRRCREEMGWERSCISGNTKMEERWRGRGTDKVSSAPIGGGTNELGGGRRGGGGEGEGGGEGGERRGR